MAQDYFSKKYNEARYKRELKERFKANHQEGSYADNSVDSVILTLTGIRHLRGRVRDDEIVAIMAAMHQQAADALAKVAEIAEANSKLKEANAQQEADARAKVSELKEAYLHYKKVNAQQADEIAGLKADAKTRDETLDQYEAANTQLAAEILGLNERCANLQRIAREAIDLGKKTLAEQDDMKHRANKANFDLAIVEAERDRAAKECQSLRHDVRDLNHKLGEANSLNRRLAKALAEAPEPQAHPDPVALAFLPLRMGLAFTVGLLAGITAKN